MPDNYRKWTKRKLQTFQFKGRPARGLMWKKNVYREWFEYVKLYRALNGKNPTSYRAFGDVSKFEFEEWWRDERYGFELFCEPKADNLVKVVDGRSSAEPNTVTLQVALNADPELTLRDFKRLMRELGSSTEYRSQAKFQPSALPKAIKPDKLRQAREAYEVSDRSPNHYVALLELSKIQFAKAQSEYNVLPWNSRRQYLQSMEKGFPYIIFPEEAPPMKIDGITVDWMAIKKFSNKYPEFRAWQRSKLRVLSNHRKTVSDTLKKLEAGVFP